MMETGFFPQWMDAQNGMGGGLNRPLRRILNPVRSQLVSEVLTNEPVTLAQIKQYLRVTTTAEDGLLTTMELSVRRWMEKYLNIALVPKVYNFWQDTTPERREWYFPINPVTSLVNIFWWDLGDVQNTWTASGNYQFNPLDTVSSVFLEVGAVWPYVTRLNDAYQVQANVGYDNVTKITPEPIQQAILVMMDDWYSNRGQLTDNSSANGNKISHFVKSLIEPYKNPVTTL